MLNNKDKTTIFVSQFILSIRIAEAPPPPLQILAIPTVPFFYLRTFIKLRIILAPLVPSGCPNATAPP